MSSQRQSPDASGAAVLATLHADLLAAVAESADTGAYAELFAYYTPRLRAYLRRTSSESSVVDDIVHDVMLTLWRDAALFQRQRTDVSTWLYCLTRDAYCRHRQQGSPSIESEAATSNDRVNGRIPGPDRATVKTALRAMSSAQWQVIESCYFGHKSYAQVADEIGMTQDAVTALAREIVARVVNNDAGSRQDAASAADAFVRR